MDFWEDQSDSAPIASRIAGTLGRRIAQGDIPAGTILTEVDVAAAEGVSRTPVREAMVRLQSWGFVRLMPKKGALVTIPTASEQRDLLEVRAMVECAAVKDVIADPDQLELLCTQLEGALAAQEAALNDENEFATADFTFHAAIAGSARNAVMRELVVNLAPRLLRLTSLAVRSRRGRLDEFHAEHRELYRAIRRRDLAGFTSAVQTHLSDGHRDYSVGQ
ncbi:DNA-binding GntR family transcriptional regulator [Leucobacter luti]|uniref:DNA-binding GntR family transcriptional regulator n=1 Tax=Leucobacter luti TaxID=340320 RepID=A0A4Q7TJC1_9MICO|nr:DNA-binding GntR family transcriptional regulator [Leucobacter luti]